ncbi:MAG: hypothetical protein ABI947_23805 [Chloroflexota bacterium]
MNEDFDALSLFAMAELNQLRTQAFDLLDRCLAENNPAPIVAFIERQVMGDPPHLQLLRDFADGLNHRLLSLQVHHFDVRRHVIKMFTDDYTVDITSLLPANALARYHEMDLDLVIAYVQEHSTTLSANDVLLLGKLLEVSIKTAARLYAEIQLTTELHTLVLDWFDALNATIGRRYWSESDYLRNQIVH